jgi:thiamine biosynthesis lipoprotein
MTSEVRDPQDASRLSSRGTALLLLGLVVLATLTVQRLVAPSGPAVHEFGGATMGTTYSVKLWGPDLPAGAVAALGDTVAGRLQEINRLMSTYDPDSELSRFNRRRDTTPVAISALTFEVLAEAGRISRASDGAFDATIGPLVEAWGFGTRDPPATPPTPGDLELLSSFVGFGLLRLDSTSGSVAKAHPDVEVDLSAIAKGFGVDRVAGALEGAGVAGYLVEVGGELRAAGTKPDGTPWRVAIERPDASRRVVHRVIDLMDLAVATSGDYRNFYEQDGRRYAHLIDPVTSSPVRHAGTSVSVLHPSCMVADAWATALSVLGPDRGLALAQEEGIAALFIWRGLEDTIYVSRATDAFATLAGTNIQQTSMP